MRKQYTMSSDMLPIIEGKVTLPNAELIDGDVGATLLHYREMHCGTALLSIVKTHWNARFFLDYGQSGQLYGSGMVAWTEWKDGGYRATAMKFAICKHQHVEGEGANHMRGWHPSRCGKCGLDMSVDSGD